MDNTGHPTTPTAKDLNLTPAKIRVLLALLDNPGSYLTTRSGVQEVIAQDGTTVTRTSQRLAEELWYDGYVETHNSRDFLTDLGEAAARTMRMTKGA